MDENFRERLVKFIDSRAPLGPTDASEIDDTEVAALLFDPHNLSFNRLLRKDISVVIGRKGSGKTALLNSYLYRPYLKGLDNDVGELEDFDLHDYRFVVPIRSDKTFGHMQKHVAGDDESHRYIESVVDEWQTLLINYALIHVFRDVYRSEPAHPSLETIRLYINSDDIRKQLEAKRLIWEPSYLTFVQRLFGSEGIGHATVVEQPEALAACLTYLKDTDSRVIIIIDSMDEYPVGEHKFDRTIGALIRFVSRFNKRNERIVIKLGFPAEIFPEIQRASANPLKDLISFDELRWTSVELIQIAAYRYRLFLRLFDPEFYAEVSSIKLNKRQGALRFWDMLIPDPQTNRYNHPEDPMTYMLRHTQLLPRQLFRMLQRVILATHRDHRTYRRFTPEAVIEAVEDMESIIAGEILGGFRHIYPFAEHLCKEILGNFPTVFSYDEIENRWRKKGRSMMRSTAPLFELVHFTEMLLRMGIMGSVERETERYMESTFAYHMLMPFSVGDNMLFSIHPIFSRYFSCARNTQGKAILPKGTTLD